MTKLISINLVELADKKNSDIDLAVTVPDVQQGP
jgi:hypothetical protein